MLILRPRAPFRLDLTVWALRRSPLNQVDRWDGCVYRRALVVDGSPVEVAVDQRGDPARPELRIALSGARAEHASLQQARTAVERMLGLAADLGPWYALAEGDESLAALARRFRGARPPRFVGVFECLVNAVALQQLSLASGMTLLNRLARTFGARISTASGTVHAFPRAADLSGARPDAIRELGFSFRKASTLIAIADAVADGELDLESLEGRSDEEVVRTLTAIPGIGRWSAEYALLRGLGRMHVFPGDDVGARANLARQLAVTGVDDYEAVRRTVASWHPHEGLVYFHLLLDRLASRGVIASDAPPQRTSSPQQ